MRKKVEQAKPGEWILGAGWDETLWPVKVTPTRWDLDEVSGGHPVFLVRIDGHIAVANTRALQLGSVNLASRDPQGGHIDRNETGEPTGILRETAQDAVLRVIPKPNHDQRRRGIATGARGSGRARRHFRAGLFARLGELPDLRRTGERGQAHARGFPSGCRSTIRSRS